MTNEMIFKTNELFESVTHEKEADSWIFSFENSIHVSAYGLWRLIKAKQIKIVSLDHGHHFGHPKPLDLVEEITKELNQKKLIEIKVNNETADLTLMISEDIRIEIFITSTGYESYDFLIQNKKYIGLGSGDIAIFDN